MNNKSNDEIFRRKCANGRMRFRTKSKIAWYCSDNFEEVDANQQLPSRNQRIPPTGDYDLDFLIDLLFDLEILNREEGWVFKS
jgi:hypothetical protein